MESRDNSAAWVFQPALELGLKELLQLLVGEECPDSAMLWEGRGCSELEWGRVSKEPHLSDVF